MVTYDIGTGAGVLIFPYAFQAARADTRLFQRCRMIGTDCTQIGIVTMPREHLVLEPCFDSRASDIDLFGGGIGSAQRAHQVDSSGGVGRKANSEWRDDVVVDTKICTTLQLDAVFIMNKDAMAGCHSD